MELCATSSLRLQCTYPFSCFRNVAAPGCGDVLPWCKEWSLQGYCGPQNSWPDSDSEVTFSIANSWCPLSCGTCGMPGRMPLCSCCTVRFVSCLEVTFCSCVAMMLINEQGTNGHPKTPTLFCMSCAHAAGQTKCVDWHTSCHTWAGRCNQTEQGKSIANYWCRSTCGTCDNGEAHCRQPDHLLCAA